MLELTTTQLVDSSLPKAGKNFIFKDRINTIKIMLVTHLIKPMKEMSWSVLKVELKLGILDQGVTSWVVVDNKYLKVKKSTLIMIKCKIY